MWIQGVEQIRGFYWGHGIACKDSRLVPVVANDMPAFGHYKRDPGDGVYRPWAIQVLELSGGRVSHLHHFLDTKLFAKFGLPPTFEG
jgi:RNA polymerase sigma-70 factor (ECF subfamily)